MTNERARRFVASAWTVEYQESRFPLSQKGWVLPAGNWEAFDPFLLMAEDWFKRGTFADHPHRGFQTVTYVVDGRLEHEDNAGGHDILEPGDVQYMKAGWTARHAEEGVQNDIAHTLQLWVNLPAEKKQEAETTYQNIYTEDAPTIDIEGGTVKVFAGDVAGHTGPMKAAVPITMTEITLKEGASYRHVLPASHNAFAYVLRGDVTLGEGDSARQLQKHDAALTGVEEEGGGESELLITSNHRRTKVLVYSGEPIGESVAARGPFVMNTDDEINQAFHDFQAGKFGPPSQ
ncbi:hypothetical protein B0H94_104186 [Salsuginibacillus halophilus]|uniref:Pirin N-terminal domain-containing protein n=1 Tax=Salsuginibacillus halophilus TaxID=517424 RepID=A0A2P8HQU4_9BACI|nr:pirin-like C-terminal cupin domain-containing protein [Salsuginibacillus halophilus]PSL48585.1 hypothetical protein B0H94_104186 [Salsuginibacillus halophilus]